LKEGALYLENSLWKATPRYTDYMIMMMTVMIIRMMTLCRQPVVSAQVAIVCRSTLLPQGINCPWLTDVRQT